MMIGAARVLAAAWLLAWAGGAWAQSVPAAPEATSASAPASAPPELPAGCRAPGANVAEPALPNFDAALRAGGKPVILAVGGFAAPRGAGGGSGYVGLAERYLETAVKGVDVVVIHRGAPGALAREGADTIKVESVLDGASLVLWQVGMGDALARMPVEEFRATLADTIDWLKAHKIDVMLVGLHYARAMTRDAHYQAIRRAVVEVAEQKGVARIRRYEVEETLARMRKARDAPTPPGEADRDCMAEWIAQAVAVGLYGRKPGRR